MRNLITDVAGLSVGNASDIDLKSGVTVLTADAPFTAGVHVMGGAPGTRETDLLAPDKLVQGADAIMLAGGSAFGLAGADGVMDGLRAAGRGFDAAGHLVPIVPAAILFDLANGGDKDWAANPYPTLGRTAYEAAGPDFDIGSAGAGTGCTLADMAGGLGSASTRLPDGTIVGALVAVNALGSAVADDEGRFWAAPFEEGQEFGGKGIATRIAPVRTKLDAMNTTLAIVATNAPLTQAECTRVATAAHDGMARALVPSHTPLDGDIVFALSTGDGPPPNHWAICHAAATTLARAIARGVYSATGPDAWKARYG